MVVGNYETFPECHVLQMSAIDYEAETTRVKTKLYRKCITAAAELIPGIFE